MLEALSFAKINLWLSLVGRRPDAYHEIRTLYQSISLHDVVRVRPSDSVLTCRCGYLGVPEDETNLVLRAAAVLRELTGSRKGAHIEISKVIPPGAGLGGGSSNAAAALLLLNRLWGTGLGVVDLLDAGARVGSDVPFFLIGGLCLGVGRGEEVYPLPDSDRRDLVVVFNGKPLSTALVYNRAGQSLTIHGFGTKMNRLSRVLCGTDPLLTSENDLEEAAAGIEPEILKIKAFLLANGAETALMCGSGSSVFGAFRDQAAAERAERACNAGGYQTFVCSTLSRAEYRRLISIAET